MLIDKHEKDVGNILNTLNSCLREQGIKSPAIITFWIVRLIKGMLDERIPLKLLDFHDMECMEKFIELTNCPYEKHSRKACVHYGTFAESVKGKCLLTSEKCLVGE
jgi:hypothetical protein